MTDPTHPTFGQPGLGDDAQPAAPTPGLVFAGQYRIDGELGRGAMGVVYRAHDLSSGRAVALKLLGGTHDDARRERFRREGELLARLRHPGILRVHGGGVDGAGRPFLALELIEGARTLDEVAPTLGDHGLSLLLDVAQAVAHAHAQGVMHRDLKPENVLIGADGRARVADFGLGWHAEAQRLTQTGALLGTPFYMAPERFLESGASASPQSDVWSLGVMLYELLCGELPFQGTSIGELLAQVSGRGLRPPRKVSGEVSPALEAVCLQALAQEPARRFADAGAFADALGAALRGQGRGARRWPGIAAAVVLLVLVCGAGGLWLWRGTRRRAWEAEVLALVGRAESAQESLERACRGARLGVSAGPASADLEEVRTTRQILSERLAASDAGGDLARQAQTALQALDQALVKAGVAACLASGDLDGAARALEALPPGEAKAPYLWALAARRGQPPEARASAQASDEVRAERDLLTAWAALEAHRPEEARRLLGRLRRVDPQVQQRARTLTARVCMAEARLQLRRGAAPQALERVSEAAGVDLAEARAGVAPLVEELVERPRADMPPRAATHLADELAARLGEECLPRAAAQLFLRAMEAGRQPGDGVEDLLHAGERLVHLDPELGLPETLAQALMFAAMSESNQGNFALSLRCMLLMARSGSEFFAQGWDRLSREQQLQLADADPAQLSVGPDWSARFLVAWAAVQILELPGHRERGPTLGQRAATQLALLREVSRLPAWVDGQVRLLAAQAENARTGDGVRYVDDLAGLIRAGHPDAHTCWLLGGLQLTSLGRNEEAVTWGRAALEAIETRIAETAQERLPPGATRLVDGWNLDLLKACKLLVNSLLALDRPSEAEVYALLAAQRSERREYRLLLPAYVRLAQERYEEALSLAREVGGGDPRNDVEAAIIAGRALLGLGRRDEARQLVEETLRRHGNEPPLLDLLRKLREG